jgi:hypothetical protein
MITNRSAKAIIEIIALMVEKMERLKLTRHIVTSSLLRVCKISRKELIITIHAPGLFHRDMICDDVFSIYQAVYDACEMTPQEGDGSRLVISSKQGQRWFKLIDGIPTEWKSTEEIEQWMQQ